MATSTGSDALDRMVERLGGTADPKRRYEYVLWLAKKLAPMPAEEQTDDIKVKDVCRRVCAGALDEGVMRWQGDSDALITKGLLALLIQGLDGLTPAQVQAVDPAFIAATGLQASLTPSRANGFLNILWPCRSRPVSWRADQQENPSGITSIHRVARNRSNTDHREWQERSAWVCWGWARLAAESLRSSRAPANATRWSVSWS